MNPIKARRLEHRKEMRRYFKALTPAERKEEDGWNGAAVAAAKAYQSNPARVLCLYAERPDHTRPQSRFRCADDRASRFASAVARLRRAESQDFDDPITQSAPGECWTLISDGYDRSLEQAARDCGMHDFETGMKILEDRTTGSWMHFKFEGELCQS